MKKVYFAILMIFTLSFISFGESDVPSEWAEEGIITIKSFDEIRESAFKNYKSNITREDFIYLSVRLYELLKDTTIQVDTSISFTDTNDIYALKGATVGITSGIGNGRFAPDILLTREQLAVLMVKTIQLAGIEFDSNATYTFMDDELFSDWARESIYLAKSNDIVNGVGNDKFNPQGYASIEHALIIANKILVKNGFVKDDNKIVLIDTKDTDNRYVIKYFEPKPQKGYYWGGYLLIPNEIKSKNMIVVANNPHSRGDTYDEMKEYAIEVLEYYHRYAIDTSSILFVPVFPRYNSTKETRALDGSMVYMSEYTLTTDELEYKDADIQTTIMIEEIRKLFAYDDIELDKDSVLLGYSSNGIFASRFSILQPDYVKCLVTGGHGWTILPIEEYNKKVLNYPFGLADVGNDKLIKREINMDKFSEIPMFVFIGKDDKNGFSYNPDEFEGIMNEFTPEEFIRVAEEVYRNINEQAEFILVDFGTHSSTPNIMYEEMIKFILSNTNRY
ncbi:MAG: S-layer homology domain-containing protein [Clostridiales bacterium]|nr:S-layer homology domain-containing protein [Clostridiales bacterium]